jgi:hypothetical protein
MLNNYDDEGAVLSLSLFMLLARLIKRLLFCPLRSPMHHAGPSHLTDVRLLTNNQEKKELRKEGDRKSKIVGVERTQFR